MRYYTIRDAAKLVGVSYNRLWYALITHRLKESSALGEHESLTTRTSTTFKNTLLSESSP